MAAKFTHIPYQAPAYGTHMQLVVALVEVALVIQVVVIAAAIPMSHHEPTTNHLLVITQVTIVGVYRTHIVAVYTVTPYPAKV